MMVSKVWNSVNSSILAEDLSLNFKIKITALIANEYELWLA